jgi:hypothetical protein
MMFKAHGFICVTADHLLIMGIGRSELDAVNDAQDAIDNARLGVTTDDMPTLPCTNALYRRVLDMGGSGLGWMMTNGVAHLPDETA